MRVVVLGAGRVGAAIALDLAADERFAVTVADRSEEALAAIAGRSATRTLRADLASEEGLSRVIAESDLVVGALPSFLGFQALATTIDLGKNCVDISFLEEDPLTLDKRAREAGVTVVVDSGLAPGLSNLVLGRALEASEAVERFCCYVGGLPLERQAPWEYKAPFSPCDVLAEYTRPARFRVDGRDVVKPALTDVEEIEFAEVGKLEAFNTDGLRTLLATADVPDMIEKTIRYPGHASKIGLLRDSGFLSTEPVSVGDVEISPLQLTSEVLFDAWRFDVGEPDVTVMRIDVETRRDGDRHRLRYELVDRFEEKSGISSMARTTGYTCTAVARLVADGAFERRGVSALEHVGKDVSCFDKVLGDLAARGVRLREVEVRAESGGEG